MAARRKGPRGWTRLSDEDLLDLRFCDLDLKLKGTWVQMMVERLHIELALRNIRCRPHVWLSSEWFSPDGIPGIGIPFYLAHPRLMKLEARQMYEVEGGAKRSCMRILRHEAGHAIETAFRLRRKKSWREVFGRATQPYPDTYKPSPYSREHVLHLDWWYAQSHPVEDFAETFAVWLTPNSRWRQVYKGWPAMRKLVYVHGLMKEIAGRTPPVRSREKVDPLPQLRRKLRTHYRQKRDRYGVELKGAYERHLKRLFSEDGRGMTAATFLRRTGPELRETVAYWTGQHSYTVDQILKEMITGCRAYALRAEQAGERTKLQAAVLLTIQVMDYLHRGGEQVAL